MPESAWAAPVMDVRPLVSIVWMFTAICIGIILIKAALNSRSFKGWLGESKVRRAVRAQLDEERYRQLHDVTLPTSDGTTQIDHIIVSIYGIFVIETKNMGGWIFGNPNQPKWTQTIGRSKNSFQNPLRQNYKHIKELDALLQIGEDKLFSVVVFAGDAEFKTDMPDNVIRSGRLARYVRTKDAPLLTESEVQRILLKINGAMLERSRTTSREHILNLNRKFGSSVDEIYSEKKRNLLITSVAIGIMVVAFVQHKLKFSTHQPDLTVKITTSNVARQNPIVFQPHDAPKPTKTPRSDEYGILTISAKSDMYITLYDKDNAGAVRTEMKNGQIKDFEIRKGYYTAEILRAGKREVSTVSFIGTTGVLEF
ncbi:nuclease-related domain-containing protein [Desulfomicrobium salsuginis]